MVHCAFFRIFAHEYSKTNYMENYFGTDPDIPDTDGDGLNDYIEILSFGYDPLKVDSDDNGISDGEEDADSDGLSNLFEVNEFGSNPIFKDTDHDGKQIKRRHHQPSIFRQESCDEETIDRQLGRTTHKRSKHHRHPSVTLRR